MRGVYVAIMEMLREKTTYKRSAVAGRTKFFPLEEFKNEASLLNSS